MAEPDWPVVVRDLLSAIRLARDAYQDMRRDRTGIDVNRIRGCELEISTIKRKANACLESSGTTTDMEWRQVVLTLMRAHSLTWEVLWFKYSGLPNRESGSGLGARGAEITKHLLTAVEALAATNPDFASVDWNGREINRPTTNRATGTT